MSENRDENEPCEDTDNCDGKEPAVFIWDSGKKDALDGAEDGSWYKDAPVNATWQLAEP